MQHSTPKPSPADIERFDLLRESGCVACYIQGVRGIVCGPLEVHHLVSGNRRMGHRYTVCLGRWHHRAVTDRLPKAEMIRVFGPSLADGSKPFHAKYGDDLQILAIADKRIGVEQIAA